MDMLQKLATEQEKTKTITARIKNINLQQELVGDINHVKQRKAEEKVWHVETFHKDNQLLIEYEELECQKKRERDALARGEFKDRGSLRYGQKIRPEFYQQIAERAVQAQKEKEKNNTLDSGISNQAPRPHYFPEKKENYLMKKIDDTVQKRKFLNRNQIASFPGEWKTQAKGQKEYKDYFKHKEQDALVFTNVANEELDALCRRKSKEAFNYNQRMEEQRNQQIANYMKS